MPKPIFYRLLLGSMAACILLLHAATASAQPYATGGNDWASSWIYYLFFGDALPASIAYGSEKIAPITSALHKALGLYSLGILVFAGILILYHVVRMVVDTAHQGVVFGRKTNQVWTPVRLVAAILLLVPLGGGLSAGQHLVLKIATTGSTIADNLADPLLDGWKESFSNLSSPQVTGLRELIGSAIALENCRLIYQQAFLGLPRDSAAAGAGPMPGFIKTPHNRLTAENWLLSNFINSTDPMCGEYRFGDFRRQPILARQQTEDLPRIADDINGYSREFADSLSSMASGIAMRTAPAFWNNSALPDMTVATDVDGIEKQLRTQLSQHLNNYDEATPLMVRGHISSLSGNGWAALGNIVYDYARLQDSYDALLSTLVPTITLPVFAYPNLAQQSLAEAANRHGLDKDTYNATAQFYSNVSRAVNRSQNWLFSGLETGGITIPASNFDLREQSTTTRDGSFYFSAFTRALDFYAQQTGVWGQDKNAQDASYPLSMGSSRGNIFAGMVDYGTRQMRLAGTIFNLISGLNNDAAIPSVFMIGFIAVLFMLGGLALSLLIPMLVMLRFILGIFRWLISVVEAVVAMPIVALAHINTEGEGLSGGLARQAYVLWLVLLMRPALTVLGLAAGFLLFGLGLGLLGFIMAPLGHFLAADTPVFLMAPSVTGVIFYDMMVLVIACASFRLINHIPDTAINWITPFVMTEGGGAAVANANPAPIMPGGNIIAQMAGPLQQQLQQIAGNNAGKRQTTTTGQTPMRSPHFPELREKAETAPPATTSNTMTPNSKRPEAVSHSAGARGTEPTGATTNPGQKNAGAQAPTTNAAFFQNKDKPNE